MLLVVLVLGMDHLLYTGLDHSPCLSPSETFHGTGGGGGGQSGVSIPKANALVESQVFPAGLGIGVSW